LTAHAGRPTTVFAASVAIAVAIVVAGCSTTTPRPGPTLEVAALTDAPSSTPRPRPSSDLHATPTASPNAPGPVIGPPVSAIVPGAVNRSSLDLTASYHVNAAITVASGSLDVTTTIRVRNDSGAPIDRLELNTIAARLGGIRVTSATVDEVPTRVKVTDQTLVVPLGGILPDGASTTVLIEYRAQLRKGTAGSDWMFTRSGGTLALYRWIPWVSRAVPFDRPNQGDPFVLPTSPKVDVELITDLPLILAAPTTEVTEIAAGAGRYWSFSMENVRDVSLVLAPDFHVFAGKADGVPIRVFARSGSNAGQRLIALAKQAVAAQAGRLGVAYPWPSLSVVETIGGTGLESPGLIWIPRSLNTLNRTYMVNHEVAHQWFYGLVGNDQQAEPFADEAAADLLARTVLGTLRPSRCGREALDRSIRAYSSGCYYEVIYVQGGLVLDAIRKQMGTTRFWAAMKTYLKQYRFALAGTKDLLETLRAASSANLLPLLKVRFPTLY
jgi:Aminopeptidase N